jgi:YVTN family beta-propeller protein
MTTFRPTAFHASGAAVLLLAATPAAAQKVVWPDVVLHLHGAGRAYILDTKSDKVLADLPTGKGATLGSTSPDGKKVYVSNAAPGETDVVVIDLEKRAVATRIKTGNRPKHALVSPDGRWVGVNHWGIDGDKLRVSFIDTKTDKVAKEIGLALGVKPEAGKSLIDYVKGVTSMHNAWSNDSRYFFTVDRVDNEFVVIDTKDWTERSIKVPSAPHYAVPSPDGREVWLVVEGKDALNPPQVIVYSVGDFRERGRVTMPLVGQKAVEGHHGNFTQDGRHFMLLNRGPGSNQSGTELVVVDSRTLRLVNRVETGSTGIGHAYNTPDGKLALITNYGNNVVTVVDTRKWSVVKNLTIGKGRMGHVAFTRDGRVAYVSNDQDGAVYKLDMRKLEVTGLIKTNGQPGGGQVLNVWTNVFEELPRRR